MWHVLHSQFSIQWHGLALGSYSSYFGRFSQSGQDNLPLTQAQTHFLLTTISSRFVLILSSSTRFWLSRSVCEIVCSERSILSLIIFVSVVASYYCILFLMEREQKCKVKIFEQYAGHKERDTTLQISVKRVSLKRGVHISRVLGRPLQMLQSLVVTIRQSRIDNCFNSFITGRHNIYLYPFYGNIQFQKIMNFFFLLNAKTNQQKLNMKI